MSALAIFGFVVFIGSVIVVLCVIFGYAANPNGGFYSNIENTLEESNKRKLKMVDESHARMLKSVDEAMENLVRSIEQGAK